MKDETAIPPNALIHQIVDHLLSVVSESSGSISDGHRDVRALALAGATAGFIAAMCENINKSDRADLATVLQAAWALGQQLANEHVDCWAGGKTRDGESLEDVAGVKTLDLNESEVGVTKELTVDQLRKVLKDCENIRDIPLENWDMRSSGSRYMH